MRFPEPGGQGAVRGAALLVGRGGVSSRAHERMPELNPVTPDADKSDPLSLFQPGSGLPRGAAYRLDVVAVARRREQQGPAAVGIQPLDPGQERALHAGSNGELIAERPSARSLIGV